MTSACFAYARCTALANKSFKSFSVVLKGKYHGELNLKKKLLFVACTVTCRRPLEFATAFVIWLQLAEARFVVP